MPMSNSIQKQVLQNNIKAIIHMRDRLKDNKFVLVLGAGVSKKFGIPDWKTLIDDIAKDKKVNGKVLLEKNKRRSHTSKTQVLFHHFATRLNSRQKQPISYGKVKNEWRKIVRKHLYSKGKSVSYIKSKHPYIQPYIELIQSIPMTVNYNFDDYIEQILQNKLSNKRIYETIWDPQLQTKQTKCVIYHPNGFLPTRDMERQSDGLVFCEDEFADQLIETMAGRYASLLHLYSQNTCLFIGLSLDDATLKHILRQSAKLNPGHYHYYIAFQKNKQNLSKQEQETIYEINFNLYNLVTLFLTEKEIFELGNLFKLDKDTFLARANNAQVSSLTYFYYVVGAIRVGKSSVISYFRNLRTHDEWPDFRIKELGMDWEKLTPNQKRKVDKWIAGQFKKKNLTLCDSVSGIHIIDRAPLDPLAFTKQKQRKRKANFLLNKICFSDGGEKVKPGHVILLLGEPEILESRAIASGKKYNKNKLIKMENALKGIYKSSNLSIVNTRNKSFPNVIKEVAKIIHKQDYVTIDLHQRLVKIKGGKFKC